MEAARKIAINPEDGFVVIQGSSLTDRQIDIRARKYADLDAEIKRLTAERDAIKAELMEAGTRVTAHWKVTCTEYVQARFDSKRFKAEHPKMFADYQTQSKSTRFTVAAI